MKSNVVIQKKNEVYLTVQCEPHVSHELADKFTFEVPAAKFMSAYKRGIGMEKSNSSVLLQVRYMLVFYLTLLSFARRKGMRLSIQTMNTMVFHQRWMNSLPLKE